MTDSRPVTDSQPVAQPSTEPSLEETSSAAERPVPSPSGSEVEHPGLVQRSMPWALLVLTLLSIFLPLSWSGLWDPHELNMADFARRIAVTVFGAKRLVIEGVANDIPTVDELGRGEFPLILVALAFKVFGLKAWVGRLPMALSGILALLGVYVTCRRLANQRTALLSTFVLLTSPLFFAQARTLLGDAVTMACLTWAFAGLSLSAFDARFKPAQRWLLWALALLAMWGGTACRGVLVGIAIPALAVGLAQCFASRRDFGAKVFLGLNLALGIGALALGVYALLSSAKGEYSRLLGLTIDPGKQFWTHDQVLHYLGHGFFPWSAIAPLAVGAALHASRSKARDAFERETGLRLCALLCVGLGVLVYTLLGEQSGQIPFAPVVALAPLVAIAILEWDRRVQGAPIMAIFVVALLVLLVMDFRHFPVKGLSVYGVSGADFPESFNHGAKLLLIYPGIVCAALLATLGMERIGFLRWIFAKLRLTQLHLQRRWIVGGALGGFALLLSFGYYPALASQLSPRGAFETYSRIAKNGEPLGTVGKQGSASAYYGNREAEHFRSVRPAVSWLLANPEERRFLVLKNADLAAANSQYRASQHKNLPVLDARSSGILLVSNQLSKGERNSNPLGKWLPDTRPNPAQPMDVEFDDKLRVLGWEIRDVKTGASTTELVTGHPYEFVIDYEVLGKLTKTWKTFIHIDGQGRRFNGDHDTLDEKYRFSLWHKGDYISDIFPFELEPEFSAGSYQVYFGLFSGKDRLRVSKGEHKDDRVSGGLVKVVAH